MVPFWFLSCGGFRRVFPARGASNCLVVVSGGGLVSVFVHGVDAVAKSGGSGLAVSSRVGGSPVGWLALVSCGFWASLRFSSSGRLLVRLSPDLQIFSLQTVSCALLVGVWFVRQVWWD